MNRIHRSIWSRVARAWVAVSEIVAAQGKTHSRQSANVESVWHRTELSEFLRPLLMVLCLACIPAMAAPSPAANTLPVGGSVSVGQATISQAGNQMQILQSSDKAALNWQSFNIGSSAGVTFQQPSSQSVALNRVAGNDPSQIFGTLSANGKLILINPNGVVFGAGSRVDASGLIATTKALSDADFMNNQYHFQGGGSGVVRNDGTLIAAPDGMILLMADQVINTGTMQVSGGTVGMVSAEDLQVSADWKTVNVVQPSVANINDVTVENFGRIDVSGIQGGHIELQGGQGTTQSEGELLAIGEQGNGGSIHLSGMQVGLMRGSLTDASGATGGGDVLIGGDWQGSGSMTHASATYMDADAVVSANATGQGNGGKAVLWSDGYTNFRGQIQANGAGSGNGGMVETSGKEKLDATGGVSAQGAQAGNWLLDPSNVTIVASSTSVLDGTNTYNPTGTTGTIANTTINTALNNGLSVTISTAAGPASTTRGVITQNAGADIVKTSGTDASLTLIADRIIDLKGNISASGPGKLDLDLDASGGSGLKTGAIITRGNLSTNGGNIRFRSGVMSLGTAAQTITTAGGAVNFNGDLEINNQAGLSIDTRTGAANGGGAVIFGGKIDSADSYTSSPGGSWNDNYSAVESGTGQNVNDTFMAEPQTELENSVVSYTSGFSNAIALYATSNTNVWAWYRGRYSGQALTVDLINPALLPNGDTVYLNWIPGQPASPSGQGLIMNSSGQWSYVSGTGGSGTVVERVAAASPLTVNAGGAGVSFSDRVGSFKPLLSLTVIGPAEINGKQVTTELGQSYSNPISIGGATSVPSTLLESTRSSLVIDQPIFVIQGSASTLTLRAAQNVTTQLPISSLVSPLSVTMIADTGAAGTGSVTVNSPITTLGGDITLTASSGITFNAALNAGGGNIVLTNSHSGNIIAAPGVAITTTGNIDVSNDDAAALPGGQIALDSLTGNAITISSNIDGLTAGTDAIVLNGPTTASGKVLVSTLAGDVAVHKDVTSSVAGDAAAIIIAAGTPAIATNAAGGNVKLISNSKLTVAPASRAIIYTGSVDDSTGVGAANAGYPGVGHYRYNVAYADVSRLPTAVAGQTYVQYRERPLLDMDVSSFHKVYDGQAVDPQHLGNYNATGWRNGDTAAINPLTGNLIFNNDPTMSAINVANYAISLNAVADTLGYELVITGTPTYTITPKMLTVTNGVVTQKVYDGTTNAQITSGTLSGVLPGDAANVTLTGMTAQFADKNAGVNKRVLVDGILGGAQSGNYTIDAAGSSTTGTITPAELRVSGVRPQDRVYDGTTNVRFTGTPVLNGVVPGDEGSVFALLQNVVGQFADKHVGVDKILVANTTMASLTGSEAANYVVAGVDVTGNSATVTPAPLQVNATPSIKFYDGTTSSDTPAAIIGLMAGDRVGEVRQVFDTAWPGRNKLLTVLGGFTADYGDNGNYFIVGNGTAHGEIKSIPAIDVMGGNQLVSDSTNLDLLSALIAFGDIRQKAEQADYFLHPGDELRHSSTHAVTTSVR